MSTLKFKRLIGISCLLMLVLLGIMTGCAQIREGKVVSMEHHYAWAYPSHRTERETHRQLTGYDSDGDPTYRTWYTYHDVDTYVLHPAYWFVVIESTDNKKGELEHAEWYVTESFYNSIKVGDWVEVPEDSRTDDGTHEEDAVWVSNIELEQYKIQTSYR